MSYLVIKTVGPAGYEFEASPLYPYTLAIISTSKSDKFKLEFLSPAGTPPPGLKSVYNGPFISIEYDGNNQGGVGHVWKLTLEKTEVLAFYSDPQSILEPVVDGDYDPVLGDLLG
jgi:hypothetical protein